MEELSSKWPEIDKDVQTWFPINDNKNLFIVLGSYLTMIFIGPIIMKNKNPLNLKLTLILYNGFQIFFSAFLIYKALLAGIFFKDLLTPTCTYIHFKTPEDHKLINIALWWYLIAKTTEMIETLLFVLRKKYSQISVLHVYHHISTFLISWCFLKYAPDEHATFTIALNSFIHVIMYFYYFLTAMGPEYQKYLWWKKYMTTMQIIQFVMIICYLTISSISNCNFKMSMIYLAMADVTTLLVLFSRFYMKSYKNKSKKIT